MKPVEKKVPAKIRVINEPSHTKAGRDPGDSPAEGCTPAREDGGGARPPRP